MVMRMNNPLMKSDAELAFRRSRKGLSSFSRALKTGTVSTGSREAIQQGVRWYVARLTMPGYRDNLSKLRRNIAELVRVQARSESVRDVLVQELNLALAELLESSKFKITHAEGQPIVVEITRPGRDGKDQTTTFKGKDLNALQAQKGAAEAARLYEKYSARAVFDGKGGLQNFHVRLNVACLLSEFVVERGDVNRGTPDARYTPASLTLCDVVDDPLQLDAIKVVAVRGLVRIMQTGKPKPDYDRRLKVVQCMIKQLDRPFQRSVLRQEMESHLQHIWYQEVLAESLAAIGIREDNQNRPIVETALAKILADSQRHFLARTAAGKALGRANLGGSFDNELRSYQLAVLASQMTDAYNKAPAAGYWNRCFQQLYFAFKAVNRDEKSSGGRPAGLLGQFPSVPLQNAYSRIVPLVAHVIVQPVEVNGKFSYLPISSEALKPLIDWMGENRPANYQPPRGTSPVSKQPAEKKAVPAVAPGSSK